jgi:hypothetical protein
MPSWIYGEEHGEGLRVKRKYLELYHGRPLEKAIDGSVVSNDLGDCYVIESSSCCEPGRIGREAARDAMLASLRLLRGIGPEKEARLKADGYLTIEDLLGHPRWKCEAKRVLGLVDAGDVRHIQRELWHWLPKSHPLNLYAAAFAGLDRLVVIDIETMGLFSRPIFLFGAAFVDGDKISTRQFLARDIGEEPAAMESFCRTVADRPIMSYNGRSFDVPYINQRRWYYDMSGELDNVHFDMLHFARRAFRDLPNARLVTIERHLFGEDRTDDVPGAMVPEFYEEYLSTGNPGPLVPVIEHNRKDMIALARLFARLCENEGCDVCHR